MKMKIIILYAIASFSSAFDDKIVGGEDTTIEEYPYQVAIEEKGYGYVCGGSLLFPNVVLTAAHCMTRSNMSAYTIRVGSTVREQSGQVAKVTRICNHSNYRNTSTDYDVSLLLLDGSFILGVCIQLVTLQPIGELVPDDIVATVTGWGYTKNNIRTKILQRVNLLKISDELCKDFLNPKVITDRMVCYGVPEGGKDTCKGDSGGPLVVNEKQVAIVSWGIKCALPHKPGVNTRLDNLEIQNHIDKCIADFHIYK